MTPVIALMQWLTANGHTPEAERGRTLQAAVDYGWWESAAADLWQWRTAIEERYPEAAAAAVGIEEALAGIRERVGI